MIDKIKELLMITQVRCKEKKDQKIWEARWLYWLLLSRRGEVSKAEPFPEKTTYKAWASLKILLLRSPSLPTTVKREDIFVNSAAGEKLRSLKVMAQVYTSVNPEVEVIKLNSAKIHRFLQLLSHSRGFFARV
jgi:hypothetical protein